MGHILEDAVHLFRPGGLSRSGGAAKASRKQLFLFSVELLEPLPDMIFHANNGRHEFFCILQPASPPEVTAYAEQLPVGPAPVRLRCGRRRCSLGRLGKRRLGRAMSTGQLPQAFGGMPVDLVQGLANRRGPRDVSVGFGLTGQYPKVPVRLFRYGIHRAVVKHQAGISIETPEPEPNILGDIVGSLKKSVADFRAGPYRVPFAKAAQFLVSREEVHGLFRRLSRTLGAPGDRGMRPGCCARGDGRSGDRRSRTQTPVCSNGAGDCARLFAHGQRPRLLRRFGHPPLAHGSLRPPAGAFPRPCQGAPGSRFRRSDRLVHGWSCSRVPVTFATAASG